MFQNIQNSVERLGPTSLHISVYYFMLEISWGWRPPWESVPGGFAAPALGILLRLHKMLIIPKTKYTLCMPLAAIIFILGKRYSTTRHKFFSDHQLISSQFDVELQTILPADSHQWLPKIIVSLDMIAKGLCFPHGVQIIFTIETTSALLEFVNQIK